MRGVGPQARVRNGERRRVAGYARDAEAKGDAKATSDAWNAVRLRDDDLGVDAAEFGAPPLGRSEPAA